MAREKGSEAGGKEEAPARRRYATARVGSLLGGLLAPAARAHGFAESSILSEWGTIVGPTLAARCQPVAVRFERGRQRTAREAGGGILVLQASGAAALELQHAASQIVERVNRFFGFPAIRGLRFVAMAVPPKPIVLRRPPRRLDAAEESRLSEAVGVIGNAELQAALLSLGRKVALRRS
ncbi:hypothetical protein SAMN07250955_107198 [Arboricoccus pini]|uniref:DUF721 domain-containing protein n=1 Tax=Arboricoccus pini TaxID=1963835 RepID=A0A212RDR1_9PROT|nr:DciA family protein [Arboricoccus pini]SNB70434.1 hypothetical protein SAMN07250955_107198 [Arboricoccus pini]